MGLSQISRHSHTVHLVYRRSSLIQQLSTSCIYVQTSNKSNSFDVLLNQSLVSKIFSTVLSITAKLLYVLLFLPPRQTHTSVLRELKLDCFGKRLVWNDCLSLGSSWVCVTYKNGCKVHAVSGVSVSSHCVVQGAPQDHILKALEGISVAYQDCREQLLKGRTSTANWNFLEGTA